MPSDKSDVDLLDKSKLEPTCNAILASALAFVKYSFVEPSATASESKVIFALPSKLVPFIVLGVESVSAEVALVAVVALAAAIPSPSTYVLVMCACTSAELGPV